jgi:hypothetical protein
MIMIVVVMTIQVSLEMVQMRVEVMMMKDTGEICTVEHVEKLRDFASRN